LLLLSLVSRRAFRLGWWLSFKKISPPAPFFPATKSGGNGLLKKMRPGAIDEAITLRRWNMTIPILRVELATANTRRPFHASTL